MKKVFTGIRHLLFFLILAGILDNLRACFWRHEHIDAYAIHSYFDSLYNEAANQQLQIQALDLRTRIAESEVDKIQIDLLTFPEGQPGYGSFNFDSFTTYSYYEYTR